LPVFTKTIIDWFDKDGIGYGDYLNFYIANGKNGTPDLRRKFLVGYDKENNDFKDFNTTGELNYVDLKIDKTSIFNINIEGLQSINDLESNKAKISYSGDTVGKENRPNYYLVTYIVYLDHS
jgi:hypothetical protein